MNKLIILLVRKKLGLKKNQHFRFENQRSETEYYWFNSTKLMKMCADGHYESAHVSLNWLLDEECHVVHIE